MKHSATLYDSLRTRLLRFSIRTKIMGIVLGMVLLLGFGVTWQVRASMTTALTTQLQERGISIARDVAARSTDLILINNTYALHELLQDTVRNNSDLRYVFILDHNGRVLVHSFDAGFPRNLLQQNTAQPGERAHPVIFQSDEGIIHDIAVPIFDGRAGVARVGLSEASVERAVNALTWQMLLTTLIVSLLGIAAAYFLTLVLTRPIRDLVHVTQAVAHGDLAQRAPIWADDEIGTLSKAFNVMVDDLSAAQILMLQRQRELTALNAVANATNAPAPLTKTLDRSLQALLDALELNGGWVFLFDRSGQTLELSNWIGLPSDIAARESSVGLRDCPCVAVLKEQRAQIISPLPPTCPLRDARLADARVITSHVTVPIVAHGRVLGVFGVASAEGVVSHAEINLLEAVGQQLGSAVENARLWDELREKEHVRGQLLEQVLSAQEQERKRIARELHDDTGQAITSLLLGLRAAGDACAPEARAQFSALREIAAQTLVSVKRLARELRPPLLDDLGLVAALERYAANYQTQFGQRVDFQATGFQDRERFASEIELTTYRVIQEALTNIVKHADARSVSIVLERKPHALMAIVEDDGCGFDLRALETAQEENKLGLFGMRERIELVNGRLQFESAPHSGTSVFVEIPLARRVGTA